MKAYMLAAVAFLFLFGFQAVLFGFQVETKREWNAKEEKDVKTLRAQIEALKTKTALLEVSQREETWAVGNNFYVCYSIFEPIREGYLLTLDLCDQGDMYQHYQGAGKFDVPDSELKTALDEVVEAAREEYTAFQYSQKGVDMPKWEDLTIKLTYYNDYLKTINPKNNQLSVN